MVQKFYLRTSRQLRHLDLEAKSPLYTHFTESLAGGVTIRAFGWVSYFIEENSLRLDISQQPCYLMFCIQRWLNLVLDLIVSGIAVVVVALAVMVPKGSSAGSIALSMFALVNFSLELTGLISVWTRLETSLGAIARLKSFLETTPCERDVTGATPLVYRMGGPAKGPSNLKASRRHIGKNLGLSLYAQLKCPKIDYFLLLERASSLA
jgi:ABC-type multidrug transport system fused ATPase/permease subunit